MAQNVVAVDRWGGGGGNEWTYLPNGEICKIFITYDQAIHTIRFTSQDENSNFELSNQFGEREGYQKVEINIDTRTEKLKGISGTFGYYQSTLLITSLGFTTDANKVYGPFGSANGTPFSLLENDQIIVGFHGCCGWWLDAIGVYVQPVSKVISAGPWGCQEPENKWTYEPKGRSLSHISITHDDAIYSIQFKSQDANGNLDHSGTYGNTTGPKSDEISIDIVNEKLNGISGTYDVKSGYVVVTSLSFSTDKKTCFGPFGCARGTAFSLLVSDQSFIGFYGRAGAWLDAIGVYIQTKTDIRVGQWGSQVPGNEFDYAPKGMISHMSITHDDAIYSIRFTSQDDEGNVDHSERFGIMTGCKSDEIDIDIKNEKLNNISGTFGVKSGYVVVTSLLFSTDKNKVFGPFGTARGTAFSLPVHNGFFSGFHGRSGYWLDAIGVYVKTT